MRKVCKAHIRISGLGKKNIEIVEEKDCDLCKLQAYFKDSKYALTEHQIIELYRLRLEKLKRNFAKDKNFPLKEEGHLETVIDRRHSVYGRGVV